MLRQPAPWAPHRIVLWRGNRATSRSNNVVGGLRHSGRTSRIAPLAANKGRPEVYEDQYWEDIAADFLIRPLVHTHRTKLRCPSPVRWQNRNLRAHLTRSPMPVPRARPANTMTSPKRARVAPIHDGKKFPNWTRSAPVAWPGLKVPVSRRRDYS